MPDPHADIEALWRLEAYECTPGERAEILARLAQEPDLAALQAEIRGLEGRLRAAPLLAEPAGLRDQIRGLIRPKPRVSTWQALFRVAASVLIFVCSWYAFAGEAPAVAQVVERPPLGEALPDLRGALMPATVATEELLTDVQAQSDGWVVLGLGAVLVAAGLYLVRRPLPLNVQGDRA